MASWSDWKFDIIHPGGRIFLLHYPCGAYLPVREDAHEVRPAHAQICPAFAKQQASGGGWCAPPGVIN